MEDKTGEYKQINRFLSSFKILQHRQESTVIASQNNTYLVRNIRIQNQQEKQRQNQLNEIINTLTQHQMFRSKNILSLIDFQIIFNESKTQSQIRAIYQYGQKSLAGQIQDRKQSELHFQEDALWGLLYSIATPLAYLQQKNIIYGVIDPQRVFLDKSISILDPSSTGINPYQIQSNRMFSPQLLKQQRAIQQIDMFKSDVFVLGLLMLQSAMLKLDLYEYDQNVINICLGQIQQIYSQNLCQLLASMLQFQVSERPSFSQVLRSISTLFEISVSQIQTLESLGPDRQNQCNSICQLNQYAERQNIDILQTQYVRFQQNVNASLSDFQKAKLRFISSQKSNYNQHLNNESFQSSQSNSFCIQDSMIKSLQKSRRVYKPRQIRQKLVRHELTYHQQKDSQTQNIRNLHKRSKTHWEQDSQKNQSNLSENRNTQRYYEKGILEASKLNIYTHPNLSHQAGSTSLNKQSLFTKPEIMNMIKNDIKRIQEKKKSSLNINFSYIQQDQKRNQACVKNKENQQNNDFRNSKQYSTYYVFSSGRKN